jgi:hypothetical protein
VHEETRINAEILEKIETIELLVFRQKSPRKSRFRKYVDFYLMKYLDGDIADHDHEVAEVHWISADEAAKVLAFSAERKIVETAVENDRRFLVLALKSISRYFCRRRTQK